MNAQKVAAPASAATAATITIQKECAYLNGTQCTDWHPNTETCRDIAHHGTPNQIKICIFWSGYGSRG